jgi:predicted ribonuclease YlaK
MKLILQRVGEDCIMILDGDDLCQVDLKDYSGNNNGLRRTSQAFRGEDIYAEVKLVNIHRSRIAQIAERM